ncbi:MAG TPA: hypothetical protein VGC54_00705 [Planctomycetota bacterium]
MARIPALLVPATLCVVLAGSLGAQAPAVWPAGGRLAFSPAASERSWNLFEDDEQQTAQFERALLRHLPETPLADLSLRGTGLELRLNEESSLRATYAHAGRPYLEPDQLLFAAAPPGMVQDHLAVGFVLYGKDTWSVGWGFHHGFASALESFRYGNREFGVRDGVSNDGVSIGFELNF